MLDTTQTGSTAFREPPGSETAALLPTYSQAPIAGGIGYARIESRWLIDGEYHVVRDLDEMTRKVPAAKFVARCIGMVRGTNELLPCNRECVVPTFEELLSLHPGLDALRKSHEVHVFALWSDDPIDQEAYDEAMGLHEGFVKQLKDLERKGEMLNAAALRAKLGWGTRPVPPHRDIVGLCIGAHQSGKWLHSHPDRA